MSLISSTVIITLAGFAADKLSSPGNGKPLSDPYCMYMVHSRCMLVIIASEKLVTHGASYPLHIASVSKHPSTKLVI